MILGLVIVSIFAGISITLVGYYTPFMILSSIFMAVGVGLLSTFKVGTGHSMWIGYQAIYGFGVGFGMQQPLIAAQTVCSLEDIPTATAIVSNFSLDYSSCWPLCESRVVFWEHFALWTSSRSSQKWFSDSKISIDQLLPDSGRCPVHISRSEHLHQQACYESCGQRPFTRSVHCPQDRSNESTDCRGSGESWRGLVCLQRCANADVLRLCRNGLFLHRGSGWHGVEVGERQEA